MNIIEIINKDIAKRKEDATNLLAEAENLSRLLPLVGKTSAIVGNCFEDEYSIVEVGDNVFSKYGDCGVITKIENIDAEHWHQVKIHFQDVDGTMYTYTADRLN